MTQFRDPYSQFGEVVRGQQPSQPADPYANFGEVVDRLPSEVSQPNFADADYTESARAEIEHMEALARQQGHDLSNEAQIAIIDKYREKAGLSRLIPTPDEIVEERIASRTSRGGAFRHFQAGVSQLGAAGESLIGIFDPDTAARLQQSRRLYYGDPSGVAGFAGQAIGETGKAVASIATTGGIGTAALYGAQGVGGVRTDVAQRRAAGDDVSGGAEWGTALAIGAVEGASGYLSAGILNKIGGVFRSSAPAIREALAQGGPTMARSVAVQALKRAGVTVGGSTAEAAEEGLTQLATNALMKVGIDPTHDLTEGVGQAALMGGTVGGLAGPIMGHAPARPQQTPTAPVGQQQYQAGAEGPLGFVDDKMLDLMAQGQTQLNIGGTNFGKAEAMAEISRRAGTQTVVDQAPEDAKQVEPTPEQVARLAGPGKVPAKEATEISDQDVARIASRKRPALPDEERVAAVETFRALTQAEEAQVRAKLPGMDPEKAAHVRELLNEAKPAPDAVQRGELIAYMARNTEEPARAEMDAEALAEDMKAERALHRGNLNTIDAKAKFVKVEVPVNKLYYPGDLSSETEQKVIKSYTEGEIPPIVAGRAADGTKPDMLLVPDGKHRAEAAKAAGRDTIAAYVPAEYAAEFSTMAPAPATPAKSAAKPTKLLHFTRAATVPAELDPAKHGTGFADAASKRKAAHAESFIPRTYFYMPGRKPEVGVVTAKAVEAEIDAGRLYDLEKDPQNLIDAGKARAEKAGISGDAQMNFVEQEIKDAGFAGYQARGVAAVFEKLAAKPVEVTPELRKGGLPPEADLVEPSAPKGKRQPNEKVRENAAKYMEDAGIDGETPTDYVKVDVERAKRIADAYEALEHNPDDPEVAAAYNAMKEETLAQWNFLKDQGVEFEPWTKEGQPYADSQEMMADVAKGHLYFFTGGDLPANHPLAEAAPGTDNLTYNDVFRAVHDYFGHAKEGLPFGPRGEENAWRVHSSMYSETARLAMTTETRGQNSWVNYGPFGEQNRANPANTKYAEQKAGLLPAEFSTDGAPPIKPPVEAPGAAPGGEEPSGPLETGHAATVAEEADDVIAARREGVIGRLRDALGRGFVPGFGRPKSWNQAKTVARGRENISRLDADVLGREFTKSMKEAGLDPEAPSTHLIIESALRGEQPVSNLPEAAQKWVARARAALDLESERAAQVFEAVGLEKKAKTYRDNIGTYLKNIPIETVTPTGKLKYAFTHAFGLRTSVAFTKIKRDKWTVMDGKKVVGKFEKQEDAKAAAERLVEAKKQQMIKKGSKATTKDLNRRAVKGIRIVKPIDASWRLKHEVHDPRYLIAKSIIETRHDAEMVRFFSFASEKWGQQPPLEITGDEDMSAEEKAEEVEKWAKENDLVKLPGSQRLHSLSNTYVPIPIAEDLTEMMRVPSQVERLYRGYLGLWKSSKTILNPATHGRNVIGNMAVFSYIAGVSPMNPRNATHYRSAIESLVKKDADYRYLMERGVIGSEYYSEEIGRLERGIKGANDGAIAETILATKAAFNRLGDIYSAEDQLFKVAAYKKYRASGMSKEAAAAEVDKWFPNYANVGKVTQWLRNSPWIGAPFVSFFDQSVRIAGRASKAHPIRVATIAALPAIINYAGALMAGVDDEEKKLLDESRTYWEPLVGFRGPKGQALTLDLRYVVPLANDLIPQTRGGSMIIPWILSGPFPNAVIEQLSGKERFTGRNFITDEMTAGEEVKARAGKLVEAVAPFPTWATYGRERIWKAATGRSEEAVALAILSTVAGANIRTPYVAEKTVRDIAKEMLGTGDTDNAEALLKLWNEVYKPKYLRAMNLRDIATAFRGGISSKRTDALKDAANAILDGRESDAKRIIADYNKNKPEGVSDIDLTLARQYADRFRVQGKSQGSR